MSTVFRFEPKIANSLRKGCEAKAGELNMLTNAFTISVLLVLSSVVFALPMLERVMP